MKVSGCRWVDVRGSSDPRGTVSFIETGRARPSREMVLHLAEHLEVPLRERNTLLLAAGAVLLITFGVAARPAEDAVQARLSQLGSMQAKIEAQLRCLGCGYLPEPLVRTHLRTRLRNTLRP